MQTATIESAATRAMTLNRGAEKYLAFHVGAEEFAIGVLGVREILGMQSITAVPQTPEYLKGIINLRGKVVPVVDLRLKFGMPAQEYSQRTSIIVVEIASEHSTRVLMGMVVDSVSEVLSLSQADIEGTPDFGEGVTIPYIRGIAKSKGKVKILLDIDRVLTTSESCSLEHLAISPQTS